jgi:hypothetical protein
VDPFDKKKAAEFYIVAWVKDWRFHTYLAAINAKDIRFEDVHKRYPWMPDKTHFYFKDQMIRAWTGMAMRPINNKLWDTDDNKKRLSLAKQVEHWTADKVNQSTAEKHDAYERRRYLMQDRQTILSNKVSVETMRKGNGHHWNVVK